MPHEDAAAEAEAKAKARSRLADLRPDAAGRRRATVLALRFWVLEFGETLISNLKP